jgi:predicted acetyltransferase
MKIIPITQETAHIFEVFEQDYESEFSLITKKEPDAEGRFAIEADWQAPNQGFYLFLEEKPAGFAIRAERNKRSDMAEFYILPCYRKKGLGKLFAFAIFDCFPGLWQVRQIPTAVDAISFWRAVIHEYTNGDYKEGEIDDPQWGFVLRQCFKSRI